MPSVEEEKVMVSGPAFWLALLIAPRKLQSLGADVQASSDALSVVVSTSKVAASATVG